VTDAVGAIPGVIQDTVSSAVQTVTNISNTVGTTAKTITNTVGNTAKKIPNLVSGTVQNIQTLTTNLVEAPLATVQNIITSTTQSLTNFSRDTSKHMASIAGTAIERMQLFLRNLSFESIREAIENALQNPTSQSIAYAAPLAQMTFMLLQNGFKNIAPFLFSFMFSDAIIVKRKNKRYGLVFDATTNKPISGAIIWVSNGSGRPQKLISNGYGMYAVLVPAGTYTLEIEKEGYRFRMNALQESIRPEHKLYAGQPIILTEPGILNLDIALERLEETQSASERLLSWRQYERRAKNVSDWVFYGGFVITAGLAILDPSWIHSILLLVYFYLLSLRGLGLSQADWGEVVSKKHHQPVPFASVKLYHTKESIERRTIADEYGRYYVFSDGGPHELKVESKAHVVTTSVVIEDEVGMVTKRVVV
jgi:hypothetical protein